MPRRRDILLALYPSGFVLLTLVGLLSPQSHGFLALGQVFAQILFLPVLLLLPFLLWQRMFLLRLSTSAALFSFLFAYPAALNLLPQRATDEATLTVMSWNQHIGSVSHAALHEVFDRHDPDIVLLQEAYWATVNPTSPLLERYPYYAGSPIHGLAILSRLPIQTSWASPHDASDAVRLIWAQIVWQEQLLTVVNAHPASPNLLGRGCEQFTCYDPTQRDSHLHKVRAIVVDLQQQQRGPLLLGGDMNVTEREPAYFMLSAGLQDAQRRAGLGFGHSWRPEALPIARGLIRIDYLFSSARLQPRHFATDCTRYGSDHCLLVAEFALRL